MPASEGFPGQHKDVVCESVSTQNVHFTFSEGCDRVSYVGWSFPKKNRLSITTMTHMVYAVGNVLRSHHDYQINKVTQRVQQTFS